MTTYPDMEVFPGVCCHKNILSGAPTLVGTRIETEYINNRFQAGESVHRLAIDYELSSGKIEDALRFEYMLQKKRRKRPNAYATGVKGA